ncbi:uncharacterized protein LOC111611594 isoform X2 [Xiphophorus maculatus]|uniref:uncharacterized protein LOC111611594 isoform X2 n=1 Tax=Xiphophorus maculatus TaxID=8083 RepID=UPI000C6D9006|nr:uncharacterized protein LOC111611594 isoform X2 [Xiphophorus maculatus]
MSKRRRPLLKSCCVQEEVEEKFRDRKFGLRQARVKTLNVYSNQCDGKKNLIKENGITKQNGEFFQGIWFVTCENKEGIMDIEKLKKGENCIACRGLWFTPPAFEEFAGRGACKKWKTSICHEGRPLTHWFAKGILSTTGYKRRGAEPMRKVTVSSGKMESKPTQSFHKFQGSKRSKYKRSSTSVTQKSISPGGFNPPGEAVEAEVQLVQDPEGSHIKDDYKQSDNDEFLKRDQKNRDDPDERNDEHGINTGDAEDENKTDNGNVLADADYLDDHGDARERHEDSDAAGAEEQEMKRKTKVIIGRLSERWRACKVKWRPKGAWCEPLEENAHIEETEGDTTVAEGNQLISENLGASSAELVVSSNGDKTDEEKDAVLDMRSPQDAEMTSSPLVKNQTSDLMCLSVAPVSLLLPFVNKEVNEKDADEAKPDHDEAESESIRASDCPKVSEKMEDGASGVSDGSDVDAMDINQLKKEKIKMQLKVLKLQEECYTLMLNNLRN